MMNETKTDRINREVIKSATGARVDVNQMIAPTTDGHLRFQISGMTQNVVTAVFWLFDNGIAAVESMADGDEEEEGPGTSNWIVVAL